MNHMHRWIVLCLLAVVPTAVSTSEPVKKTKVDPRKVEVVFADGSVVKMTLIQDDVEITSRYGKFRVPVEEIARIEFGFRFPEGIEERVKQGIAGLGAKKFRDREAASTELLELGEYSYLALQEAQRSTDAEVAKRAEELLKKLDETLEEEKRSIPRHDTLHTRDFAFPGRIEATHFRARTPYFGEIQVALAEIRGMRSIGATNYQTFTLDAGKYASLDTSIWRDTGIDVTRETLIEVEAAGTVQVYTGTGYPSNPDGYKGFTPPQGQPLAGALIARIGTKGHIFTLGSRFKGKAPESGRLYVRIQQGPWMTESSGSYEVKLKTTYGVSAPDLLSKPQPKPPQFEKLDKKIFIEKVKDEK